MPSTREQVILAVIDLVGVALPSATVTRNAAKAEKIGPNGTVIISDGDPGEPEMTFSPTTYIYDHRIPVEIAANKTAALTAEAALDAMLIAIGEAVEADRTLGGLCDHLRVEAPMTDELTAPGAVASRWAEVMLVATYGTTNPLA